MEKEFPNLPFGHIFPLIEQYFMEEILPACAEVEEKKFISFLRSPSR